MDLQVPASSTLPLKHIWGHLVILLLAGLITATAVVWTLQQQQSAYLNLQNAKAQQTETRTRLARVSDDEHEIRTRISYYRDIAARGLLEPEQRLQWVEMLRDIRDSRRLLGLNYEIAPQRPFGSPSVTGGHLFLASRMKLDMPLLHEEDLLGLLDDVSERSHALINVNRCQIERIPPTTSNGATLQATCEIDWIKLQEQPQ